MSTVIYAIQAGENGPVKIGFSTEGGVQNRLSGLQTGNAEMLSVVATIKADRINEKLLHKKLQRHHLRGEWFQSGAIETLREFEPIIPEPVANLKATEKLKIWLRQRGMMQRDLAERLGIDVTEMSKIMRGARKPNLLRATAIERITKGQVRMKDWTIPFQLEAAE